MSNSPSWIGKKLSDRYEIEQLLGQGGMSAVYKANDPNLRRTVAVKLIHSHLSSDPQFVSRFEEEAAAVAQLRHPNIIQVYDFSNDGDTFYMVLEYVLGETLEQMLKRLADEKRQMSPKDAIEIIASVCDALEYAHSRGMIHRDIKPANIMKNVEGQSILMDFGVAKIVGGKQHTATGAVVGTALYMAPEIIKGEQPDHRVDIYSLGVTLFEALSGRPPFVADSAMTTLMMHVNDPVPNLQELNHAVPESLFAVVKKSLAKDKKDRYQTAKEFAEALRSVNLSAGGTTIESIAPGLQGTMIEEPAGMQGTMIEQPTSLSGAGSTMVDQPPPSSGVGRMPPPPTPAAAGGGKKKSGLFSGIGLIAIIGAGLLFVLIIGFFGLRAVFSGSGDEPTATAEVAAVVATDTTAPTEAVLPTDTLAPTEPPTTTPPPEPYVLITNITLSGSNYIVEYQTFGYTEVLPGMHVHFFFNTVPPAQAGVGGSGPWYVWGGPRPFDKYRTSDKPAGATQMCALVANTNHTIILDTGNCFDLPQ